MHTNWRKTYDALGKQQWTSEFIFLMKCYIVQLQRIRQSKIVYHNIKQKIWKITCSNYNGAKNSCCSRWKELNCQIDHENKKQHNVALETLQLIQVIWDMKKDNTYL